MREWHPPNSKWHESIILFLVYRPTYFTYHHISECDNLTQHPPRATFFRKWQVRDKGQNCGTFSRKESALETLSIHVRIDDYLPYAVWIWHKMDLRCVVFGSHSLAASGETHSTWKFGSRSSSLCFSVTEANPCDYLRPPFFPPSFPRPYFQPWNLSLSAT